MCTARDNQKIRPHTDHFAVTSTSAHQVASEPKTKRVNRGAGAVHEDVEMLSKDDNNNKRME
jgi:hypothetical protein